MTSPRASEGTAMQGLLHTVGGGVSMSEVLVFFFFGDRIVI